jgi:hypothetical protein
MVDLLVDHVGLHSIECADYHDSVHYAARELCGLNFLGLQVSLRRVLGA